QREALLARLFTEQHVLLQELARNWVLRVPDERLDGLADTIARAHGGARRAEVDAEVEDAVVLLRRRARPEVGWVGFDGGHAVLLRAHGSGWVRARDSLGAQGR